MVIVLIMLIVLAVTLAGAFQTRGVMAYLPFLQARKGSWTGAYVPPGVVDQRPWQTAATLAALAQSAEEKELAQEAELVPMLFLETTAADLTRGCAAATHGTRWQGARRQTHATGSPSTASVPNFEAGADADALALR